jgi:hypothetical protein
MNTYNVIFEAEILFLEPDDVPHAVQVFTALGCHFEIHRDAVDPCGPTVFGLLTGTTELDEDDLGDWLREILTPLGADLYEWGCVRRVA